MKPYGTDGSKKEEVRQMFDAIAPSYDRLNHLLSFNLDRGWRRRCVRMATKSKPAAVLDMATGTGDLAFALARKLPQSKIVGADLSPEMIRVARDKSAKRKEGSRVEFSVGDGEALGFGDGAFDCATIAFGIRNYQDIDAGLREFARVLRSGGELYVLEFSTPTGKIFAPLYRFYFHRILPIIGGLVSKDKQAYTYLPGSVDEFPEKSIFLQMMCDAGFAKAESMRLMRGVAFIYKGTK